MTAAGFCDVFALSRYTSGRSPAMRRSRIGKSFRILVTSYVAGCATVMTVSSRLGGRLHVLVVALGLELVGELAPAPLGDPSGDEHVHEVGLDVLQDPRVVRDQQQSLVGLRRVAVDAVGHYAERVDVEAGVGLVEHGELGVE